MSDHSGPAAGPLATIAEDRSGLDANHSGSSDGGDGSVSRPAVPKPLKTSLSMSDIHNQLAQASLLSLNKSHAISAVEPSEPRDSPPSRPDSAPAVRPAAARFSAASASAQSSPAGTPLATPTASFHSTSEMPTPRIYKAMYSGIEVYEMLVGHTTVMKRVSDDTVNATQILKVAGLDKTKRTRIIEREIRTTPYEKIQGGYGKYQGTWVPRERGAEIAQHYGVLELIAPLLYYDEKAQATQTPTKEQVVAAKKRRSIAGPFVGSAGSAGSASSALGLPEMGLGSVSAPASASASASAASVSASTSALLPAIYQHDLHNPYAPYGLAPLEAETVENFYHSKEMITKIFMTQDTDRLVDIFGSSEAIESVNFDIAIDDLGHTALHWAAALGRVGLVEELVRHGANRLRCNHAGETPLVKAVLVTNNLDQGTFPQLLDVLYPNLGIVDQMGRTVLHHIAVTSGIRGRSDASRYYLSSLLEWVVTRGGQVVPPVGFARFVTEVVNCQDKSGDTCLTLAALVGNKAIVQQLLEVGADPGVPNRVGLRAVDFGIVINGAELAEFRPRGVYGGSGGSGGGSGSGGSADGTGRADGDGSGEGDGEGSGSGSGEGSGSREGNGEGSGSGGDAADSGVARVNPFDKVEKSRTTLAAMKTMLDGLAAEFQEELQGKEEVIREMREQLVVSSGKIAESRKRYEHLKALSVRLMELKQRSQNLDRAIAEEKRKLGPGSELGSEAGNEASGAKTETERNSERNSGSEATDASRAAPEPNADAEFTVRSIYDHVAQQHAAILSGKSANTGYIELSGSLDAYPDLPALAELQARLAAYRQNQDALVALREDLKLRSSELEAKFRRVVSLCTGVPEEQVDSLLEGLVQAVESDPVNVDTARIVGFLRRAVDTV